MQRTTQKTLLTSANDGYFHNCTFTCTERSLLQSSLDGCRFPQALCLGQFGLNSVSAVSFPLTGVTVRPEFDLAIASLILLVSVLVGLCTGMQLTLQHMERNQVRMVVGGIGSPSETHNSSSAVTDRVSKHTGFQHRTLNGAAVARRSRVAFRDLTFVDTMLRSIILHHDRSATPGSETVALSAHGNHPFVQGCLLELVQISVGFA